MFVIWIDFQDNMKLNCIGCKLRHKSCHSHCPHGIQRTKMFERLRNERETQSMLNAYEKEAKTRMRRSKSTNGMRV